MPHGFPDVRRIAWWFCAIVSALICIGWVSLGNLEELPISRIVLFFASGVCMLGLVFFFPNTSDQRMARSIIILGILLRLLLWAAPVSDDVNRYIWEGELVLAGENPYAATADDPRWENRRDEFWELMNHRDRPTAYPPGIQWVMAATTAFNADYLGFKLLALAGDFACIFLLIRLLRETGTPLRWAGFYAFNPIVLIGFAAEAHFDSLMIAALLVAVLAHRKGRPTAWLWLGLAIQIKLVCIVLIPLFLTRKSFRRFYLLALILLLPSLPFALALPGWIEGVREFAGNGAFNAPLHTLLSSIGLPHGVTRLILTTAFLLTAGLISILKWRERIDLAEACLWMFSGLLAFSPIVHFWYVAWLLPFVCVRPSFAWVTLSVTMAGYFAAWWTASHLGWWGFGHGVAAVIWIPWLLAMLAQNRFLPKRLQTPPLSPSEPKISVVLPVLNPGKQLEEFIEKINISAGEPLDIVVVDAGSEGSKPKGSFLSISSEKGRGNQIAAGIENTDSEWILIAHVDTIPRQGFLDDVRKTISLRPSASMFVLGQRFDKQTPGTLLIEVLNEIRVVFGGVAFGDQTMIVRREALQQTGGFPAQPLMEDVEVSLRLATAGPIHYLDRPWVVSAKKWETRFGKRVFMIFRLVATYQFARLKGPANAQTISRKMYAEYYS